MVFFCQPALVLPDQYSIVTGKALGLTTEALKYRGREMAAHDALVYHPGQEQEYTTPPDTKSLVVIVAPRLARSMGWNLNGRRIQPVSEEGIRRLVEVCSEVCSEVTGIAIQSKPLSVPGVVEEALRDRVLTTLRGLLEPWLCGEEEANDRWQDPTPTFRLVKQAEQLMAQADPQRKLDIAELAGELEVPQRTLYEAFRKWLGIGPYEYYLLRRMHAFREALLAGEPYHGKVKQAAIAGGFNHVARLTQSYRRHFGESPGATLKRRSTGIGRTSSGDGF